MNRIRHHKASEPSEVQHETRFFLQSWKPDRRSHHQHANFTYHDCHRGPVTGDGASMDHHFERSRRTPRLPLGLDRSSRASLVSWSSSLANSGFRDLCDGKLEGRAQSSVPPSSPTVNEILCSGYCFLREREETFLSNFDGIDETNMNRDGSVRLLEIHGAPKWYTCSTVELAARLPSQSSLVENCFRSDSLSVFLE